MKKIYGLILATMLSTAVMAQVATNEPPALPTPPPADTSAAVAPAPPIPPEASATNTTTTAKPKVKKAKKKKKAAAAPAAAAVSSEMPARLPLVTNEMAVAFQNHVNIRGQAHINSEVIGHLKKGDTVTVLELITLKHPKTDEPANWARIALPDSVHVWINNHYLDLSNNVVRARKENIRTGPGENFSVIGRLVKGDTIKPISAKGDWSEIEPPTNAFGFVAAHLLSHAEAAATVPPVLAATTPAPTTTTVESGTPIAAPGSEVPGSTNAAPMTMAPPPPVPVAPPTPAVEEPLPERIVEREGVVGGTVSIQAPTHYELRSLDNGRVLDYLYTTSTNVPMKLYKGLTVYVTGPEELDERWPNTPVITIQKIQVVK